MLKLCGFAASNYYNKVKFALLEKGVPFQEELVWPGTSAEFFAKTPLGKIPYIEAEGMVLTESEPILEYIESTYPDVPLLPQDRCSAAKVRELIQFVELYLEWEARNLYGAAFFGGAASEETRDRVRRRLDSALVAFARLTSLTEFAVGDRFSLADCALAVHLPTVGLATKLIYGEDLLGTPAVTRYLERLGSRPALQRVHADRKENTALFIARARGL